MFSIQVSMCMDRKIECFHVTLTLSLVLEFFCAVEVHSNLDKSYFSSFVSISCRGQVLELHLCFGMLLMFQKELEVDVCTMCTRVWFYLCVVTD